VFFVALVVEALSVADKVDQFVARSRGYVIGGGGEWLH
jgi:hypothetical protein